VASVLRSPSAILSLPTVAEPGRRDMRRHLASFPAKLLLAVVLLIGGCAYERNRAPLVAPVARNETFGLTLPPADGFG
jgi:hypothetical protein